MHKFWVIPFLLLQGLFPKIWAQPVNNTYLLPGSHTSISTQLLLVNDSIYLNTSRWDINTNRIFRGFLKVDMEGNVIQQTDYWFPYTDLYPGYMSMLAEGEFLYISSVSEDSLSIVRSHLFKCNRAGDTVWTKRYEHPTGFISTNSLISHPDGGFVLLGIVKEELANESDIFILRTDTAGNELWRKVWGMPGRSEEIRNLVYIGNDEYIGGGSVNVYPPGFPTDNLYYRGLLVKFRNNGTVLSKEMGRPLQSEWVPGYIKQTGSGEFLIPSYISDDAVNSDLRKSIMYTIDTGLNLTDTKFIEDDFISRGVGGLLELNDMNYLLWGSVGAVLGFQSALFIKTDSSGEILWRRTYSYPGSDISVLADAAELADGTLLMCGQTIPPQKIWFVRTDEYGCLVPGCQYIGVEEASSPNFAVRVYPNPASDLLYIFNPSSDDLPARLIDLGGKAVKTELMLPAGGTFILPLSELPAGIYFLRVNLPGGRYLTEKIVKQ